MAEGLIPYRRAAIRTLLHRPENLIPAGRGGNAGKCHPRGGILCLRQRVLPVWTPEFLSFTLLPS